MKIDGFTIDEHKTAVYTLVFDYFDQFNELTGHDAGRLATLAEQSLENELKIISESD